MLTVSDEQISQRSIVTYLASLEKILRKIEFLQYLWKVLATEKR